MTGTPCTADQNWLQQDRTALKPTMSCSWPKTSTLFALRAAGVRGTFAHDSANGAAAIVALLPVAALRLTAVADDAMIITASAAPAIVAMRLSIFPSAFARA
jgi:hypothetical protein